MRFFLPKSEKIVIQQNNRSLLVDLRLELAKKNIGQISLVAGEARPEVYEKILELYYNTKLPDNYSNHDMRVVCGPQIAVREDKYEKHYNDYEKREKDWWKIHPLFEAKEKGWIRLFLKQHQRIVNHFCVGLENKSVYIETPHRPMMSETNYVHKRNRVAYQKKLREFEGLIGSDDVVEINKWEDLDNIEGLEFIKEDVMLARSKKEKE